MIKENSRYAIAFNPYSLESIPYQKADAIRQLGYELAEKLQDGERIVVKLESNNPSEYEIHEAINQGRTPWLPPCFEYRLDIGVVRERVEVPVWKEVDTYIAPMPQYKIEATDSKPMAKELARRAGRKIRYHLRWWTAAKVDADIMAWRTQ